MSASEIIAELPKLSLADRRRLAGAIFDLEADAELLRDCDKRADERFAMLDDMETRQRTNRLCAKSKEESLR